MVVASHILGTYTMDFNPDSMDIPEKEKTVSTVDTYSGSAIFQWPAIIEGVLVTLEWDWMSIAQYNALNALYLSTDTISWNPQYAGIYQVIVSKFSGKYIKVNLNDIAYRAKVKMVLNIRSGPVAVPDP
jgi:hypothetical protein